MPKTYSVHQVLTMLDDEPDLTQAEIFILPPADPNCSDEDSGDEDAGIMNNLTRRQLEANAEVRIHTGIGENAVSRTLGQHDLTDDEIENATQEIETDTLVAELNAP